METAKRTLVLSDLTISPDLTVSQVAVELGLHAETVRRLLAQGDLPGYRAGGRWRVSRTQLNEFKSTGGVKKPGRPERKRDQK